MRQSSVALPRATARSSTFMDASVSSSSSLSRVSWSRPSEPRLPRQVPVLDVPEEAALPRRQRGGGRIANAAEERSATRREEDAT